MNKRTEINIDLTNIKEVNIEASLDRDGKECIKLKYGDYNDTVINLKMNKIRFYDLVDFLRRYKDRLELIEKEEI